MPDISTVIAKSQNIVAKRGDTFGPVIFQFFTLVNGVELPIDITTDIFNMKVCINKFTNSIMIFSVGNGFVIQNTNELVMSKSAESMKVPAGYYTYAIERTQANGIVSTELIGDFIIQDDLRK